MHEFSVASRIVEIASREAGERGAKKVKSVHLIVGRLTHLSREQLTFCYDILKEKTILKGSRLIVTLQEPKVECTSCGYKGPISKLEEQAISIWAVSLACPRCKGPIKIIEGLECKIKSIRMVVEDKTIGSRASTAEGD